MGQAVGCGVNVEVGVCGQVIRGRRKAVVHSGRGTLTEEVRTVVCIPMMKRKRDLFEFACPLLEVITDLERDCKHISRGFKQGHVLTAMLQV